MLTSTSYTDVRGISMEGDIDGNEKADDLPGPQSRGRVRRRLVAKRDARRVMGPRSVNGAFADAIQGGERVGRGRGRVASRANASVAAGAGSHTNREHMGAR